MSGLKVKTALPDAPWKTKKAPTRERLYEGSCYITTGFVLNATFILLGKIHPVSHAPQTGQIALQKQNCVRICFKSIFNVFTDLMI